MHSRNIIMDEPSSSNNRRRNPVRAIRLKDKENDTQPITTTSTTTVKKNKIVPSTKTTTTSSSIDTIIKSAATTTKAEEITSTKAKLETITGKCTILVPSSINTTNHKKRSTEQQQQVEQELIPDPEDNDISTTNTTSIDNTTVPKTSNGIINSDKSRNGTSSSSSSKTCTTIQPSSAMTTTTTTTPYIPTDVVDNESNNNIQNMYDESTHTATSSSLGLTDVDTTASSSSSSLEHITNTSNVTIDTFITTSMMESIINKYPKTFQEKSKLHQFVVQLQQKKTSSNCINATICTSTTATTTTTTATTPNISDAFQAIWYDTMEIQQMLLRAEHRIEELQQQQQQLSLNNNITTKTDNNHMDHPNNVGIPVPGMDNNKPLIVINPDGSNNNGTDQTIHIQQLEKKLQMSYATIEQLKKQKQHIISNMNKQKVLCNEMKMTLESNQKQNDIVLNENHTLRKQLFDMTRIRDKMKQKICHQQEIVKYSKQCMIKLKQKLEKQKIIYHYETDLLDQFRKLALSTGYHKAGKDIKKLEIEIAAAYRIDESTINVSEHDFD